MTLDVNQIYNLLPSVYRVRDAQAALDAPYSLDPSEFAELQGLLALSSLTPLQQQTLATLQDKQQSGPLKGLISILAEQIAVLEDSMLQSYDDLFIETCADWVVPYIAELVGLRGLVDLPSAGYTVRAAVADAIANRRRKGTVPALEQVAREVTDWGANVVEYFQYLCTTQYMNHIRPANLSVSDIRNADSQLLNTPFDSYARTAEVRNIESGLGRYNIPNIGVWLWRLQSQLLEDAAPFVVDSRRFCFDPLGRDLPLFTNPASEAGDAARATPLNVAMPISRRMLAGNLSGYYGAGLSIYVTWTGGPPATTPVCACNLSDVLNTSGQVTGWAHAPTKTIGIDPELGRLVFPSSFAAPAAIQVSYCYACPAPMGGGPYARVFDTLADVSVPTAAPTIQAAIHQAIAMISGSKNAVVVEIEDNGTYVETPTITLPAGGSLQLRARDGKRPLLALSGDLVVTGGNESLCNFNGLLISGGSLSVRQAGTDLADSVTLQLSHCTVNPAATPAIGVAPAQAPLPSLYIDETNITVTVDHSILGAIRIGGSSTVSLTSSIVDALSPMDVAYACYLDATAAGSPLTVVNSTIIGKVHTTRMDLASNSIFVAELTPAEQAGEAAAQRIDLWTAPVIADQLQQGCVRFCFVPSGSRLPRLFHCYPVAGQNSSPGFTSLHFGDPAYGQLTSRSGLVLTGADDNSEIGVYHDLYQPQRLANLNIMLTDFLRFGMEAGVFFAT